MRLNYIKVMPVKNNFYIICLLVLFTIVMPISAVGQQIEKEPIESIQEEWLYALNNGAPLNPFYTRNSGLMLHDTLFIGVEEIVTQLQGLKKKASTFEKYKIIEEHQLRDNQKFAFGEYITTGGGVFRSIIGWKKGGKWTKEFEVIYMHNKDFTLEVDSINQARENWEEFANQHRPDLIVANVFSDNGKYFNRGNLYKDKQIITAYSYMSNDRYSIKLEPMTVSQINSSVIFEIGIFKAGGQGYTLIWLKELDSWKLLLDFNF
jgi:hypothetical protein